MTAFFDFDDRRLFGCVLGFFYVYLITALVVLIVSVWCFWLILFLLFFFASCHCVGVD